jgi:hypothetical protein
VDKIPKILTIKMFEEIIINNDEDSSMGERDK